jgi:hypothetical protein
VDECQGSFDFVLKDQSQQTTDDSKNDSVLLGHPDVKYGEHPDNPHADSNQNGYLAPGNAMFLLSEIINVRQSVAHAEGEDGSDG